MLLVLKFVDASRVYKLNETFQDFLIHMSDNKELNMMLATFMQLCLIMLRICLLIHLFCCLLIFTSEGISFRYLEIIKEFIQELMEGKSPESIAETILSDGSF